MRMIFLTTLLVSAASNVQGEAVFFDDFNNGSLTDADTFTGGSPSGFWNATSNWIENSGNLETTVSNSGAFRSRILTSGNFSNVWDVFNNNVVLSVRGISISDSSTGGDGIPTGSMRTSYSLIANGSNGWNATDSINVHVFGNGRAQLLFESSSTTSGWGTVVETLDFGIDNAVTGFDVILNPNGSNLDYTFNVFDSGSTMNETGSFAMTSADWDSVAPNTGALGVFSQELDEANVEASESFTLMVGSISVNAIAVPEPTCSLLLALGLGCVALRRKK